MTSRCKGAAVVLCLTLMTFGTTAKAENPQVVVSIKPVHSLVSMVLEGITEPYLIVKGANSPHGYAMRPSDAKALAGARAVFWIGPALETFLTKPLSTLARDSRVVALGDDAPGETTHDARKPAEGDGHEHGGIDPHVWLDPSHALEMLEQIAETMIDILPAEKARIENNRDHALSALKSLEAGMRQTLAPYTHEYVVVLHEAYSHFTRHFGMQDFIALTVNPEHKPSPGRIMEIRKAISTKAVRCVFAEPEFPETYTALLLEGTGAKPSTLDPLGATLKPGPDLYPRMMESMAASLKNCLSGTS